MARTDSLIVAVLPIAVFATLAGGSMRAVDIDGMQAAIQAYRNGQYDLAEGLAQDLTENETDPVPRAWLILAEVRRHRGQYDRAAEAYRQYLASCDSARLRRYVRRRLQECEAPPPTTNNPSTPSERLTPSELAELAEVRDRIYTESSEHFIVRAPNPKVARLVTELAEDSLRRICGVILGGQAWPHTVEIYVWADREQFLKHAEDAPEYAGGSFTLRYTPDGIVRRIDLTQMDSDGTFDAAMLDRKLPHELAHLVIHEFFGESHCPLFLDEGLAMLAEAEVDHKRILLAGSALAAGDGGSLDRLFRSDRADLDDPEVFYAKSFSFVSFLHERMTQEQFRRFLEHVKAGSTIEDAIQRALRIPPDESFLPQLAAAWEDHAIAEAQYLRALDVGEGILE